MVVITPSAWSFDGVADPEQAEFTASLDDTDDIARGPAEEVIRFIGAEAAIAWGRERAEIVLIALDSHWDTQTSFSAGIKPWYLEGIHDAPLPSWPGSANVEPPPEGWHVPPDADTMGQLEAAVRKRLAEEPAVYEPYRRPPDDPIFQAEPPASTRLSATFKWEDEDKDGEDIGPLVVFDPDKGVIWEAPDWMRVSEARALAEAKGWQFGIDGSSK